MAHREFYYIIIYDIRDERRLRKIAKIMEKYGKRVQYSVFEVRGDPLLIEVIRNEYIPIINPEEDSVVIYKLCDSDWKKREKYGRKTDYEDTSPNDIFIF